MSSMIVPNWHPIVVHFSVALLITATMILFVAKIRKQNNPDERLQAAGRMMFWIGAGALVLTVLAGLQAYYGVAHDEPSHRAMTDHRNWAFGALVLTALAGVFMWVSRAKPLSHLAIISLIFSTGLVSTTAYKGGELVYRYGLGVMSMPSVTSEGHDHSGGSHDHKTPDTGKTSDHKADCKHIH